MYDCVIVGSGVAGCNILYNLFNRYSGKNKKVLLIERGCYPKYVIDSNNLNIIYVYGLGGSANYSVGNTVKVDLSFLKVGPSEIDEGYSRIKNQLNIKTTPECFIDDTSKNLLKNYGFERMDKFINFNSCSACGLCSSRLCDSKWIPINYLIDCGFEDIKQFKNNIINNNFNNKNNKNFNKNFNNFNDLNLINNKMDSNFKILFNTEVKRIDKFNNYFKLKLSNNNNTFEINTKNIVLCAGGINSPRLLKTICDNEYIGKNLFIDMFITVGGVLKDCNLSNNIQMTVFKKYDGILLSNHYSKLLYDDLSKNSSINPRDIYGIMVKIKDENNGYVDINKVKKNITDNDRKLLNKGIKISKKILEDFNVSNLTKTIVRGSHPGGTCSYNNVLNYNFESDIKNLYVCDSSVFPKSLGLPPILGILTMSEIFTKYFNL